jgi:Zn-dependent peptidase ImmA (M78 family)/DNA-binding XRE family transcriptional regulator
MSYAWPERITQARELMGLSKTELAEKLGVSPAAVAQWESGMKHPTPEKIAAMARALGVEMPLLVKPHPPEVLRRGMLSFRSCKSVAQVKKHHRKATRIAELIAEAFFWVEQKVDLPTPDLPDVDIAKPTPDAISDAALQCRRYWGLGDRPILKLGELLELKGVVINEVSFGNDRFDAFSCIMNGRPFVFLGNDKQDRARSRFDAAHELGHLILHKHISEIEMCEIGTHDRLEREANLFAAAFLMPCAAFKSDVRNPSLNTLLNLKPKWGASVQAMVVWSRDLGIIDDRQYRQFWRRMAYKGWRRSRGEPLDELVPPVRCTLGRRSLSLLQRANVVGVFDLTAELPMPPSVLRSAFQVDVPESSSAESGEIIRLPDDLFRGFHN